MARQTLWCIPSATHWSRSAKVPRVSVDACAQFLKPTGRTAFCVIDPRQPKRRLTVDVDGEEGFVGYGENEPGLPPVPFSAGDVAEFIPQWNPIAQALAPAVRFDHGAWETEGQMRSIGSLQDKFGHVRAVLLFLPGGHLGDYTFLLQALVQLPGDPFKKMRGAFIPVFQVSLHPGLEAEITRREPR